MKQMVFSVFDSVAAVYGNPIFVVNRGIAVRSFSDAVSDSASSLAKHAADYKLYFLGEFDTVSGELIKLRAPEFVCNASDFITHKEVKNG